MTISAGTVQYTANVPPVGALGVSYSDQELDDALSIEVSEILYDLSGRELLAEIIEGIEGTGFNDSELKSFLNPDVLPEDWRVGEPIAASAQRLKVLDPWIPRSCCLPRRLPALTDTEMGL
jgi:hypothetical protein